ncbi:hypothetical protein FACS1894202_09730 [Clostridia bacterium]|nr:hypothetical protein FACS1894202_09730 [Clostridia bacterium]
MSGKKTFGLVLKSLFIGGKARSVLEEELIQSPAKAAFKNFMSQKLAVAGAVIFILVVLSCIILSFVFPLNLNYVDMTQINVPPGFYFLDVPSALKNNALVVDPGATFGAGIDRDGKVYVWGQLASSTASEKLYRIPKDIGKLKDISCGLDHVLALGEDGKTIYTWGNDRLGLTNIPMEMKNREIVQIEAGENISVALGKNGKLYVWGSQTLIKISTRLAHDEKIEKFALNSVTALVLTENRNVYALTSADVPVGRIPSDIAGRVIDVAASKDSGAAITDDGRVHVWGSKDYGVQEVPEEIQGHAVSITAGRYHYSAVLDDGTVTSWGMTNFGQSDAPSVVNAAEVRSAFLNNIAVQADGKVVTWGLKGYPLGSDQYGRDVFRRLISGGQVTLTVGAVSVIIAGIIGVIIGGISGYYMGKVDMFLMRATEVVSAIPFLPLAIILSAIIGNRISESMRIFMIMLILGLLSWPGLARLTRAQILSERENEFVTAAKAMGVKESGIIFRHILPNVIAVLLVSLTLDLATCMLIESTLSFLGFGVQEPNATWGNMLNSCVDSTVIRKYWWRWVFPSITLGLATISVNLIGDGLRDAIDPKANDR